MTDAERKARLTANLTKARALARLAQSEDYQNCLLPYLKALAQVPFIDPTLHKSKQDYLFALDAANIRAGAYAELVSFLARQEEVIKKLASELEKKPVSYVLD